VNLGVLAEIILALAVLLLCLCSACFLFVKRSQSEALLRRSNRAVWIVLLTMIFGGITALSMGFAFARDESSPFPWDAFCKDLPRNGFIDATTTVFIVITADLWLFLVPGHLWARSVATRHGKWPVYPYIINILVGLLLCTPSNPIAFVLNHVFSHSPEYP
jgi:hypothetical protein